MLVCTRDPKFQDHLTREGFRTSEFQDQLAQENKELVEESGQLVRNFMQLRDDMESMKVERENWIRRATSLAKENDELKSSLSLQSQTVVIREDRSSSHHSHSDVEEEKVLVPQGQIYRHNMQQIVDVASIYNGNDEFKVIPRLENGRVVLQQKYPIVEAPRMSTGSNHPSPRHEDEEEFDAPIGQDDRECDLSKLFNLDVDPEEFKTLKSLISSELPVNLLPWILRRHEDMRQRTSSQVKNLTAQVTTLEEQLRVGQASQIQGEAQELQDMTSQRAQLLEQVESQRQTMADDAQTQ